MKKRLTITHETEYNFTNEVFLQPHYLRHKPRVSYSNKIVRSRLSIFPPPVGISEQYDAENNIVHFCWFDGMHRNLVVHSESIVILKENDPQRFIVFPNGYFDIPFSYSPMLKEVLFALLSTGKIKDPLSQYGLNLLKKSTCKTLNFVVNLTKQIHDDFEMKLSSDDAPIDPNYSFEQKKGSSLNISWIQIQLLRHLGIVAKFVNGYYYIESKTANYELHYWLEVYLPGAGWVGFDPYHGNLAGSCHIPICSSAYYQNTLTVIGSYKGEAQSSISTWLTIEKD